MTISFYKTADNFLQVYSLILFTYAIALKPADILQTLEQKR